MTYSELQELLRRAREAFAALTPEQQAAFRREQELLRRAREAFAALTPEQQAAFRREQAIDWAYGNLKATTRHREGVTREMVAAAYDAREAPLHTPAQDAIARDVGCYLSDEPQRCGCFRTYDGATCVKETDHDGSHAFDPHTTKIKFDPAGVLPRGSLHCHGCTDDFCQGCCDCVCDVCGHPGPSATPDGPRCAEHMPEPREEPQGAPYDFCHQCGCGPGRSCSCYCHAR